ncbi:MAG: uracil-DNA glycosylase family protein [Shewanella sp.]|nr:uracil-DNA glycosylase family protein [Shewanella sp.]MCF1431905.1 uracil-DNA glycosylase family protein [Shewanella sp.]MCF1439191.1 uracil-DNA glycosylase family protein [Shewanella sp.]MCF1458022.1 uracil-DNA glycosylase family protein [Shewanella sp.]
MKGDKLSSMLADIRACTLCQHALPLPARPILQAGSGARILVAGQAPGSKTHDKGRPFDDASGERLRNWLGVDKETFYNPDCFAIVPMGFCYPGTFEKGGKKRGDKPPRPECCATWHPQLLPLLTNIELTLVLGQYAIDYHLAAAGKLTVTRAVQSWQDFWPDKMVLPHPSPRNNLWLKRHPKFEQTLLPLLQARVQQLLGH